MIYASNISVPLVPLETPTFQIIKINTFGEVLMEINLPPLHPLSQKLSEAYITDNDQVENGFLRRDIDISAQEEILICHPKGIISLENDGEIVHEFLPPSADSIIKAKFFLGDQYLVADKNKIYVLDSLGNLVFERTYSDLVIDIVFMEEDSSIFALESTKLVHLDLDLKLIDSFDLENILDEAVSLKLKSDGI